MPKSKTKKLHGLRKFIILLTILAGYMLFVITKFGVSEGLAATALTWAFFVTCTPIADAGFILDFPLRLLFGIKMIISEILVWAIAFAISGYFYFVNIAVFQNLEILKLFLAIIENPWPLWSIVLVSAAGTFLSIYIGDQIYTMVQQHNHHKHIKKLQFKRLALEVVVFIFVVGLYFALLGLTEITI